jgi:hypothetical protein
MTAPLLFVTALVILACFQLALALGAPIGHFAWGGQHRVLPRRLRIGSLVSIAIYAMFALVVLDRAGRIDAFPDRFSEIATWVIFGYLVLGIGMNAISRSRAERFTMVPVTIVLAGLALIIALG